MLYKVVGAATIFFASISILAQIVLLPYLFNYSDNIKSLFKQRIQRFNAYSDQFDIQSARLTQLGARPKRQIIRERCPPPYPGPPGPPGQPGPDGEEGTPGKDGPRGLDAQTQLTDLYNQCIVCPAGPAGHTGPPGHVGFDGAPGERGDPGIPGKDAVDGEQGEEGFQGMIGLPGTPGKPGTPGLPAPGGTGPPGPAGAPGPIGSPGAQGPRGGRNFVYGDTGKEGRPGTPGYDGLEGPSGPRGLKGPPGEPGANAKFCPCPMELSKLAKGGRRPSHLKTPQVSDAKSIAYGARIVDAHKPVPVEEAGATDAPLTVLKTKTHATGEPPRPLQVVDGGEAQGQPLIKIGKISGAHTEHQVKSIAYEDAYPTYEDARKKVDYDTVPETVSTLHEGGSSSEKAPEAVHEGGAAPESLQHDSTPEQKFVDVNLNDLEQATEAPAFEPEATTRRRFAYVTKKPRPAVIWN